MRYVLTGQEMAAADAAASVKIGIPSIVLMERAALSVADEITAVLPKGGRIMILSGPGNNGADGLAAGRILTDRGYDVRFMLLSGRAPAEGSSMMTQQRILSAYGIRPEVFDSEAFEAFAPQIVVDALFGTGLGRDLDGTARKIVECVTAYRGRTGAMVVGLDLPSGISSEDGRVMGCAPRCDLTVTFAYYKRGHFLYPGAEYCGRTVLKEIGITDLSFRQPGERTPIMFMKEPKDAAADLPARDPAGNKGTFGKILIIAGSTGMCGAAVLSARAALRSGAGMVKVFTTEKNRVIVQQAVPEALLTTYDADGDRETIKDKLLADLAWADTAAIGPGIGRGGTAKFLIQTLLEAVSSDGPQDQAESPVRGKGPRGIVIDADALRILAGDEAIMRRLAERDEGVGCILTPHPAEFADLMHCDIGEALRDRPALLKKLADKERCAVIGKDARTMIAGAGREEICLITNGNCGMATAGSGDVLTGIAAALLCQTKETEDEPGMRRAQLRAAETAAYIHAAAGDRAKEKLGESAMIAGDIAGEIGGAIRDLAGAGGR